MMARIFCSLPDRQLRNRPKSAALPKNCSLPDRQLRKASRCLERRPKGSLPDRQLRKHTEQRG